MPPAFELPDLQIARNEISCHEALLCWKSL
jgi:hypothetical protein